MSDIERRYADIIDLRLSSDRTVARLVAEGRALEDEGDPAGARQLIRLALGGTALMPHQKQRLRELADAELGDAESGDGEAG